VTFLLSVGNASLHTTYYRVSRHINSRASNSAGQINNRCRCILCTRTLTHVYSRDLPKCRTVMVLTTPLLSETVHDIDAETKVRLTLLKNTKNATSKGNFFFSAVRAHPLPDCTFHNGEDDPFSPTSYHVVAFGYLTPSSV